MDLADFSYADFNPVQMTQINKPIRYTSIILPILLYLTFLDGEWLMSWDDSVYVVGNELVKTVSFENINKIFTSFYFANYNPLHLLSYMVDYQLWGLNPIGYRVTNLLLHIINGLLIFKIAVAILSQMSEIEERYIGLLAWWASSIFLCHPTAVESVVWVSERKNLLAMTFILIAFFSYIKYRVTGARISYLLTIAAFVLSLLSKASAVVFPLLTFLYDYCLHIKGTRYLNKKVWMETLPLLLLSIAAAVAAIQAQASFGAIKVYAGKSIWFQILTSVRTLTYYLYYAFFPINLSAFYSIPLIKSASDPRILRSFLVIIMVLSMTLYSSRKAPLILFCIGWFFIPILPVSGVVPLSNSMADRYLYISMMGVSIFIPFMIFTIFKVAVPGLKSSRYFISIILIPLSFIIVAFSQLTTVRATIWQSELTLWDDALYKGPTAQGISNLLGVWHLNRGKNREALFLFTKGLEVVKNIDESDELAKELLCNKGKALYNLGDYGRALVEFEKIVRLDPGFSEAYLGQALVYSAYGDKEKALTYIEKYVTLLAASKRAKTNPKSLADAREWVKKIRER